MRTKYKVPLLVVCSIIAVALALNIGTTTTMSSNSNAQRLNYGSTVQIFKNGILVSQDSNLLFATGNETIETALKGGTIGSVSNITLCNSTAGCGQPLTGAGGETWSEYNSCGMAGAIGGIVDRGAGNYSVSKIFVSSCDGISTNATRISNTTSNNGVTFAGYNFTTVTLQQNDQVNVTWYIWIS